MSTIGNSVLCLSVTTLQFFPVVGTLGAVLSLVNDVIDIVEDVEETDV